jgi:hypothetical protein
MCGYLQPAYVIPSQQAHKGEIHTPNGAPLTQGARGFKQEGIKGFQYTFSQRASTLDSRFLRFRPRMNMGTIGSRVGVANPRKR